MWSNSHHQFWQSKIRQQSLKLTTPIIYMIDTPFTAITQWANYFTRQQTLIAANNHLHNQQLLLQGQLQRLAALETKNQQLQQLLQSAPVKNHLRLMIARVMAISTNSYRQELTLDKGSHDGVFIGQAVLDAYGIMGQIIAVAPHFATLLLLTDTRSAIPIVDNRNGLSGILSGQGISPDLLWRDLPPTTDIKLNDQLISSGLGGHYPAGYPVGIITIIRHTNQKPFLIVKVQPIAHISSDQPVLLVWPA